MTTLLIDELKFEREKFTEPIQRVLEELTLDYFPSKYWALAFKPRRGTSSAYYRYHHQHPFDDNDTDPYEPSPFFLLRYVPTKNIYNAFEGWIPATNFITVEFGNHYATKHPDAPEQNEMEASPKRYTVSGAFTDQVLTADPTAVLDELESSIPRTENATQYNQAIERATLDSALGNIDVETALENDDFADRQSPVRVVHGCGSTTEHRLGQDFGTYTNLPSGDHRKIRNATSDYYQVEAAEIKTAVSETIDRYGELQQREDWDAGEFEADRWSDYPKRPTSVF